MLLPFSCACLLLCLQADPPPPGTAPPPADLLEVAERESVRLRRLYESEVREVLDHLSAHRQPSAAQREAILQRVTTLGPEVVEVLVEAVRDPPPPDPESAAYYAVLALSRLAQPDPEGPVDQAVLQQILAVIDAESHVRSVLQGLDGLRDPLVSDLARRYLDHRDKQVVAAAVQLLSLQQEPDIAALLRPLLQGPAEVVVPVIRALRAAGDTESRGAVASLLSRDQADSRTVEALRYLRDCGDFNSLGAIRQLLQHPEANLPDHVVLLALEAVQHIGLTHPDSCAAPAEELLLTAWENAIAPGDQQRIALLLGPYHNERAYQFLVRLPRERLRAGSDAGVQLELCEIQLRFERWDEAIKSARQAEKADERKALTGVVASYKVVAYCGLGEFERAERELRELDQPPADLLLQWPQLKEMAEHPKYRHHFAPPADSGQ